MIILIALISQLQLADSLYAHGYFEEARVEYLRVFFYYPEFNKNAEVRLRYAISLLNHNQSEGIAELHTLINEFPVLPRSVRVEIAKRFIQSGRFYLAINMLEDTDERKLLGLAYLLDGQFSNALATFIENGDHEIASIIEKHMQHPEKSENTAALLSLFMPGSGEVYADNPGLGARDFLLNLGSGYLIYNALKQHKYVDAMLVFVFLLNRFYLGSIHNAQKSALEYNEEKRREWLAHVIDTYFTDLYTQTR